MANPDPAPRSSTQYLLFAACAPGLETLLLEELAELGLGGSVSPGGVELRVDAPGLWTLCWRSRLAESVRVRLKPFVARDFDVLTRELARLPWRAYLRAGDVVHVRVVAHKSRLWHSDAVAERVLDVLRERVGVGAAASAARAPSVHLRLTKDRVQVSMDASGERLHRRGYRSHVAEASLRETLAAALVRVAHGEAPEAQALWDPFCGAGTIGLEWLELRLGRAAGARRRFAFQDWPTHDAAGFARWVAAQAATPGGAGDALRVIGSDVSAKALHAARANATSAELESHCRWIHGDFESAVAEIPLGAVVVSNPPYGVRVRRAGELLARLRRVLQVRRDLRPVVLLLPTDARLSRQAPLRFERRFRTSNGGLAVVVEALGRDVGER